MASRESLSPLRVTPSGAVLTGFELPGFGGGLWELRELCALVLALLALASCVPKPRAPQPAQAPPAAVEPRPLTAAVLGVSAGPRLDFLDETAARRALGAFS